jgi:molybdate transport system substrate-binding protein
VRVLRNGTLAVGIGLTIATATAQAPLALAAASDLQAALPEIAARFERETGQTVTLTFGSSGNFFSQIQNGAPFDVFLSADIDYPRQLERLGLAEPGSVYEYATGHLVLWTRNDSGIDVKPGLTVLTSRAVHKVAIANPALAPYGRAAVAALRHEGLYARVEAKLVVGENISQTAQFVLTGNADVGLLALSLALGPVLKNAGVYAEIPPSFYSPIEQAAIIVGSSKQKALARQFIDFLKKPETMRVLQSFGFALPVTTAR